MTEKQKQTITQMRGEGRSYAQIAKTIGVSENTVKSYCKRNNLGGRAGTGTTEPAAKFGVCKACGKGLPEPKGTKPRKFCSSFCRTNWWATHPHEIQQKAVYHFTCGGCGAAFTAYGNKGRKYCSHACYIESRFGTGDDDE